LNHTFQLKVITVVASLFFSSTAVATNSTELKSIVEQRLIGDRTGACWAVAVIDREVATAIVCADVKTQRTITEHTAFEIGSISKTMNGALLSLLMADGKLKLDDPLDQFIQVPVPSFEGKKITLRHLVSHTSGLPALPSRFAPKNQANPYADLTENLLLESLADVRLSVAPGSGSSYSNWGAMLLSYVLSKVADKNYESLLGERLFKPLGMQSAFITIPAGTIGTSALAQGHLQSGIATSRWDFPLNLAGVGGVRANLNDMVRYLQGQMKAAAGKETTDLALMAALKAAHAPVIEGSESAMGWMRAKLNDRIILAHEGGTGGFSSFAAFDESGNKGVVILSDTSFSNIGGLSSLGAHLLDSSVPLGKPRKLVPVSVELAKGLAGRYQMASDSSTLTFELKETKTSDGQPELTLVIDGQQPYPLKLDSAGDLFLTPVDAVVRPRKRSDGSYGVSYLQGGGNVSVKRLTDKGTIAIDAPKLTAKELSAFEGVYQLSPNFAVRIFLQGPMLMAQATGQSSFAIEPVRPESFSAQAFGIEIVFKRDNEGNVAGLDLYQGGRISPAKKVQ
jgi:serine-type D-Ala-D-Ala carboxypeptidase/endopeptidase